MYDVIVIGARCAGSPTAMLLARKGYKVLLLDRAAFPSDIMSTHFIQQAGTARLQRWGLLDQVRESNCPPVSKVRLDFGDLLVEGTPPAAGEVHDAFSPRRYVLDDILVKAAVSAGAELRQRFTVRDLIYGEEGRVTGIRGATQGGSVVEEQTRVVIGADGLHSMVAKSVGAPIIREHPVVSCGYYSYWSGVGMDAFEVHPRDGWAVAGFPTNDGLSCMIVGASIKHFDEFRSNVEPTYMRAFSEIAPEIAERMRNGRRESPIRGSGEFLNQFRKAYGPGWALVGDAGYHKDPSTAQGITDAFRDAELLTDAIDEGLSGRRTLDEALAGYQAERDAAAGPMFDFTCHMAALEPLPADMQHLMSALSRKPAFANQFAGLLAGTVAIPDFFSDANMARIFEPAAV